MKQTALFVSAASLLFVVGCQPTATPTNEVTSTDNTTPAAVVVEEETVTTEVVTPDPVAPVDEAVPALPPAEEAKPEAEVAKPEAEVAKPEAEVAKPEAEVAKPEAEEAKPEAEEAKPEAEVESTSTSDSAVSSYAPADALMTQVNSYLEEMEKDLADEATYTDKKDTVSEDAAGLAIFYLALGLNDQDNPCKAKAANLIKAAQAIATAADYAAVKAGFDAIKTAAASDEALSWKKVSALPALMKQVPAIDTKMKRTIPKRMDKKQDECLAMCAAVAALMQGSIANADETEKPAESAQWTAFSVLGRDAAAAVGKAVAAQDKSAASDAMDALHKSCDQCHAVFHQKALGK